MLPRRPCLCLLLWALTWSTLAAQVRSITFRCLPEDAEVYLDVSGTHPYRLGFSNQPIPLDLNQWIGRETRIVFRRTGWQDESRTLPAFYFSKDAGGRDSYPPPAEGPVRMNPQGDLASRWLQLQLAFRQQGWLWAAGLVVAGLAVRGLRASRRPAPAPALPDAEAGFPWELPEGARLGPYQVERRIGEGVSAVVYEVSEAADRSRRSALKLLKPNELRSADVLGRFRREMKALGKLNHPGIPRLFELGDYRGMPYLAMELVSGSNLKERLQDGPLAIDEILLILRQLCQALAFAHGAGVLHRDVKPENVCFRQGDPPQALLMDFGLARSHDSTTLTAEGALLGTPLYMAPELMHGTPTSASTDQYAMGCLAYHLLAGQPPFRGESALSILVQHAQARPPRLTSLREDLPDGLEAVLDRMLAKRQEDRFPDMDAVFEALAQF